MVTTSTISKDILKFKNKTVMYKVKQSDLIGDIKEFPIEVVQKMVDYQVKQGNKADVTVFQNKKSAWRYAEGFDFYDTIEGHDFWVQVINFSNFDAFFERYPNKNVYYRGVKDRGDEIIKALESLEATNINCYNGADTDYLYFIDNTDNINAYRTKSLGGDILRRGFTELFLPEIKTVDIDGKKFRKDEVVEIIKEKGLKEVK